MRKIFWVIIIAVVAYTFTGCKFLTQSIMFKTPKGYVFDTIPDTTLKQYILQPNDIFYFRLFANDGFKLIDLTTGTGSSGNSQIFNQQNQNMFKYNMEFDGTAKLPILGRVRLAGMTVRQAELFLQEKYAFSFNDPFVQMTVLNRRVFVFPGEYGKAGVIGLSNDNTTLMEALALAGGISENGKAQRVKLLRKTNDPNNPLVYEFDLSTIEGLRFANMIVQTEDIVYVEPRRRVGSNILKEVLPWVTLLTTVLLTITTVQALKAL
ncbi:MAG: polysaccharide biosynthesis/export family protein [Flavobacteriales bacterium]|nr:polysaccharide biosynthesis/export family protein [Flavobacteriales bacterium]